MQDSTSTRALSAGIVLRVASRRTPYLAVYLLVLLASMSDAALTPLLPTLRHGLQLSELEIATIVSATTATLLIVSIPVGAAADRLGARRLVLAAALLCIAAQLGMAVADGYAELIGARVLFGVAFGIIWTVGPAVLVAAPSGSAAMGRTIAVAGAGLLVGPVCSGLIEGAAGRRAPFLVLAALGVVPLVGLIRGSAFDAPVARTAPLRGLIRSAARDHELRSALVVVGVLGVASSVTTFAGPLQLAADGLSASAIGLVFSTAAVVWIGAAWIAGRVEGARIRPRLVAAGVLALGVAWSLPTANGAALVVAVCLLLSASCRAPLNTFIYVLGQRGKSASTTGAGAVVGLINAVWGVAAMSAPPLASILHDHAGPRLPFAVVTLSALMAGAWLLAQGRRPAVGLPVRT